VNVTKHHHDEDVTVQVPAIQIGNGSSSLVTCCLSSEGSIYPGINTIQEPLFARAASSGVILEGFGAE
jgi:hypothetical protein